MNKLKVQCSEQLIDVGTEFNVRLWIPSTGFGYGCELHICTNCGEIYALDREALKDPAIDINESLDQPCQSCGTNLRHSLRAYPETFRTPNGKISNYPGTGYEEPSKLITKKFLSLNKMLNQ